MKRAEYERICAELQRTGEKLSKEDEAIIYNLVDKGLEEEMPGEVEAWVFERIPAYLKAKYSENLIKVIIIEDIEESTHG